MTTYAEMLIDGHRILPALLADIEAAETSIHVSMFLFFHDPIGDAVAEALARRAKAGVKVRVLLNIEKTSMGDPFSTGEHEMMKHDPNVHHNPLDVKPMCKAMRDAGVEVLDTNIDYDLVPKHISARLQSKVAQINEAISVDEMHIDHRKLVVIDGAIAYCGGANIGAQYMFFHAFDPEKKARVEGDERKAAGLEEPWWKWHDSLTRFQGEIVEKLDAHFRERWELDGGEELAPTALHAVPPRGHPVKVASIHCNEPNAKPNEVRELYCKLIGEAQRSIFIENPYLYQPELVEALIAAKTARPALDVTLIVPAGENNDSSFSQDAQEHNYLRYLECGIAVHEYQNHFNHLKTAVFDERFSIHGSTNLNCRSLENDKDFELVVLVDDEAFARWVLTHVRDVDLGHAKRIGESDVHGSFAALRRRVRDPRTLALLAKRML